MNCTVCPLKADKRYVQGRLMAQVPPVAGRTEIARGALALTLLGGAQPTVPSDVGVEMCKHSYIHIREKK